MLIRSTAQLIGGAFLCAALHLAACHSADSAASNGTFGASLLDSVASCWSADAQQDGSACLKGKLYKICEQFLRHKLVDSLTPEERSELTRYQPMMGKMIRLLERDSQHSWLDTKVSNQLKLLFEDSPSDENEGRKKKNKGMGQIIMMSLVSGLAVMLPIVFKVIFLMAAKALVAGKVAIILSALSHFNKHPHHEHDSVHETSLRRQALMQ